MKNKDLQQLFNEYIYECQYSSVLRPETLRGYKEAFRHFSNLMQEVKEIKALTAENMAEFFKRLQVRKRIVGKNTEKTGVRDSTVRTYWSKLNSFFVWLKNKQIIKENPLSKIKPPQPRYDDHKSLETADIQKIITAINLHSKNNLMKKRDTMIVYALLFCGLRRGEITGLRVQDVDINKRILTVRGETSKSKRMRQIPINPILHMQLDDYLKERGGYKTERLVVSITKDTGFTSHGFKHWVNRLRVLSGVRFHLHQFRHTFACGLANNNATSVKIQKLMGHTDLRMTERYLRSLGVEDMRDEINKLTLDNL